MKRLSNILKNISVLLVLLLGFPNYYIRAQVFTFNNYSINDGLPQSKVNAIIQDNKGYLWFATDVGVGKFDGKNFIIYTSRQGLFNDIINTIYKDKQGNLWFGHSNGGITFYDGKIFRSAKLTGVEGLVFSILDDHKDRLWIATEGGGLFKLNFKDAIVKIKSKKIIQYNDKNGLSNVVTSIMEDQSGQIWTICPGVGIKKYLESTDKFDFFQPIGLPAEQFTSIAQDSNGIYYFGTWGGNIISYQNTQNIFKTIYSTKESSTFFITKLYIDRDNNLLIGTWGNGFYIYNKSNKNLSLNNSPKEKEMNGFTEKNGLCENKIRSLFQDREGNYWIGTNGGGVSCYQNDNLIAYFYNQNAKIFSIIQDNSGNYWFGSRNFVYFLNPTKGLEHIENIDITKSIGAGDVFSLCKDGQGNIWIGTWGAGVGILNASKHTIQSLSEKTSFSEKYVNFVTSDKNNNIWIGTISGLSVYKPDENKIKTYTIRDGLSNDNIAALYEMKDGSMVIGSRGNWLTLYKNGKFSIMPSVNVAASPNATSMAMDKLGNLWIGSEGGGIYKYDGEKIYSYVIDCEIPVNFINLLEIDNKNNLWIGTNQGIIKHNLSDRTNVVYTKFNRFFKIETKSNAVCLDKNNFLWFGTSNGTIRFNTNTYKVNSYEPLTYIKSVRIFLKDTIKKSTPSLTYKQNHLTFDFIGICFSDPEKVKYQFKLEGLESEWEPVTNLNFVTYSNLKPGKYIFQLKSCNNDGIWIKSPVMYQVIIINPPFWQTWWFRIGIVIILVFGVVMYIKVRERKLIKDKRVLEEKVKQRTAEVVRQKEEILEKNKEIENKNKNITDSIRYALRIQQVILPSDDFIKRTVPSYFLIYTPKDIVSGDFYWVSESLTKDKTIIVAAVDCTGHGVPGAFMSIIGYNLLNQIINEQFIVKPSEILNNLSINLRSYLQKTSEEDTIRDGMDIALYTYHPDTMMLEFAAVHNPLYIIRNNELIELKHDCLPIGEPFDEFFLSYRSHEIKLQKGDKLYLFTDGFIDQFGGPDNKRFMSRRFKEVLVQISNNSMEEQKDILMGSFDDWKGKNEQYDDVLIIGIEI